MNEHLYFTRKTLVLSTAHITRETMEIFDDMAFTSGDIPGVGASEEFPFYLAAVDYGYILVLHYNPDWKDMLESPWANNHPDLRDIIIFAVSKDYGYIHLDGDGLEIEELPSYEW